jgi:hypothetical protein
MQTSLMTFTLRLLLFVVAPPKNSALAVTGLDVVNGPLRFRIWFLKQRQRQYQTSLKTSIETNAPGTVFTTLYFHGNL